MNDELLITEEAKHLPPQQQKALNLLASGKTISQVSREMEIHRTTIWRWTTTPEFQATLNALVAEARAEMQQGLASLQEKAINTLKECMSSPNHMVRVRTALSVLDRVSGMRQGPTSAQSIRQMALPIGPEDFSDVTRNLYNS